MATTPTAISEILVRDDVRPLRHRPRRERTATAALRALPLEAPDAPATGQPGRAARAAAPGLRGLTVRDLAAGGGGATLSWTLAAHLGLLGTAAGTFMISVLSAIAVAVAGDSLRGLRQMALRCVRSAQERRTPSGRRIHVRRT